MRLTRFLPCYLAAATLSAIHQGTPGAWPLAAALWLPPVLMLYLVACGVPFAAWTAIREGQSGAALALAALMLGPVVVGWMLGRSNLST